MKPDTRQTLDVYEGAKPSVNVRVAEGFKLSTADMSGPWLVVPTEEGGEIAISLTTTVRLVMRQRTLADEARWDAKIQALREQTEQLETAA